MSKRVTFKARGGADAAGEIAQPSEEKAPGLVVIQEWWGVNDHIKGLVDRFAAEGFVVLAPDLFHGKVVPNKDSAEAGKMMHQLDQAKALDEIAGAVEALRQNAACSGKVGVTGFCMGGALSFAAACNVPGLSAVVPFYGLPDPSKVDYAKVTAPIQAHFARRDEWAKPSVAEEIQRTLEARGQTMELHVYEAGHAFMNDTRPEAYDEPSARLAWQRTVAFLHKHLG